MTNRLKSCLNEIIHEDQTGFMKGRNIGSNIRTIIDLIEYCDANDIPGSIVFILKRLSTRWSMIICMRL